MLAKELITDDIPSLKPSDTVARALSWMDEFKVTHLPVAKGNLFKGMISEIDLLDQYDDTIPIKKCDLEFLLIGANPEQHVFDVVKTISTSGLTVIPVIDEEKNYLGSITMNHLMEVIADMSVVSDPGGIIVLEMGQHDYYLSEIARLIEGNDAKILGTFITSHPDSTKLLVTLKINRKDLSPILQTLERYDYKIAAHFDEARPDDDLKDRFDSLMNYLNI